MTTPFNVFAAIDKQDKPTRRVTALGNLSPEVHVGDYIEAKAGTGRVAYISPGGVLWFHNERGCYVCVMKHESARKIPAPAPTAAWPA